MDLSAPRRGLKTEGGAELARRTCLGGKRRWLRLDSFGRPDRRVCCEGNLFAVQGSNPTRSSVAENARAMGVDVGHMGWNRLAQAIPPAYTQLLAAQAVMHEVHNRFGVPIITHDDLVGRAQPSRESKRTMALWLTGAGLDAADAGLQFVSVQRSLGEAAAAAAPDEVAVIEQPAEEVRAAVKRWRSTADLDLRGEDLWAVDDWSISENEYREAYYSWAGGFDAHWVGEFAPAWWRAYSARPRSSEASSQEGWLQSNTYVHLTAPALEAAIPWTGRQNGSSLGHLIQ